VRPDKVPAGLHGLGGHFHGLGRRGREALGAALHLAGFRDAVERLLGRLDLGERGDLLGRVGGVRHELRADADQLAEQGEVVDLGSAVARGEQHAVVFGQAQQVGGAAELGHGRVGLEERAQRDRVGDHVAVGQLPALLEDAAVQRLVEMLGPHAAAHVLHQPVLDHHRAKQRLFRIQVVRHGRRRLAGERSLRGGGRGVGDDVHGGGTMRPRARPAKPLAPVDSVDQRDRLIRNAAPVSAGAPATWPGCQRR
jgi:hypothetical protein